MTEPTLPSDPTTAILVAVTKMDGKLDTALTVQALHSTDISTLQGKVDLHSQKIVALETARAGDTDHAQWRLSSKATFWTAVAGIVAIVGLIITLVIALHHGA